MCIKSCAIKQGENVSTLDMDLHPWVLSDIVSNVTKSAFRDLLKKQVTGCRLYLWK